MTDPERKRKIIGATFIDVFQTATKKAGQREVSRAGHDFIPT